MNYDFVKLGELGKENRFIQTSQMDPGIRPSLGTQMRLGRSSSTKLWKVVLVSPPTNPSNQKVTYFMKEV